MVAAETIRRFADEVAARFEPDRIVLFGSHAYGRPHEASDVDLLVVMPDGGDPLGKAMQVRSTIRHPFPLDLLVRNAADLRWRLEQGDWLLREAVEKGQVLYEAADG